MDAALLYNLLLVLAMTVLVVVGVHIITRVRRSIHEVDDRQADDDLLGTFQAAYINGEIDAAELQRVRQSLEKRVPTAPAFPPSPPLADPGTPPTADQAPLP
jgi:hypothetical protein